MTAIANAAFPVAVGLIMLAAIARATLAWTDDPQATRLAREYLVPLTTWSLVATFLYLGAHAAAGDIGIWTVVVAAVIGGAAVFLRDSTPAEEPEPPAPEPVQAPPAAAAAPPRSTGSLWYGR